MKRAIIIVVTIIVIYSLQSFAFAATVNSDDYNRVTSVEGLVVQDIGTYNVEFYHGTYLQIFPTGNVFSGSSEQARNDLNNALNDQGLGELSNILFEGFGGGEYTNNHYLIPWGNIISGHIMTTDGVFSSGNWGVATPTNPAVTDSQFYAKFSPVPIPGAIWLLGSGLIGMVGVRRKLRK